MCNFLNDLSKANDNGKYSVYLHMMLFKVSRCGDYVAHQKTLKRGGACKVKEYFYFCCTTSSVECYLPNDTNCVKYYSEKDS